MHEKKYGEVPVVIQAALRHGQVESWMYEAMALAMRAGATPRTKTWSGRCLSAVDFASDENQVIMVAAYMAQAGLQQRALKLYQQIGNANPSRPEPFIQGLALAQRLNDVAAIQWACVGLLVASLDRRAHGDRRRGVSRRPGDVSSSSVDAGRKSEAEAFEAAVRKAQRRDCVVMVTWTGDADIDMSVEEPAGTVVSQRQPRSTSGGVHLGDVSAADGKSTAKGFSEATFARKGLRASIAC